MIITRIKLPLSQHLQIFRNIRKKSRAPQVQFRFILDERQYVLPGLFVINVRKTFVEKPDQAIPIQRILFPDKSGIDQPRLQMRQIDRRPFCKIKDISLKCVPLCCLSETLTGYLTPQTLPFLPR